MARVVVAGAGMGGLRAAESLRGAGYAGEIVVVGAEEYPPYNRPPLSKEALADGVTLEAVVLRRRASVDDVVWRFGTPVAGADLDRRRIRLADGEELAYDGLVVATGLRPLRLPVPGPPAGAAHGRHVLRTLDDAADLRAALAAGPRLVVVGAGFVGSEVAATARGLGAAVTCVAADPAPMVAAVGPLLADEMRRRHEAHGVDYRLGTGVAAYEGDGRVTGVRLATGEVLPADVLLEAVGSRPNVDWLEGNDVDLTDGVLADTALRPLRGDGTPWPDVVVVGDVARYPNRLFDDVPRRVEHWNMPTETARRAGAVLAATLAGDAPVADGDWRPLPSFWSDQYDLRLQSFGLPSLGEETRVVAGDLHDEVVVEHRRDGVLVGVTGIGLLTDVLSRRTAIGTRG